MEVRQRTTLSDQMTVSNSSNLRDLLKIKEENERRESLTLGSILGCSDREKQEIAAAAEAANRTLLDIIRDEEGNTDAYRSIVDGRNSSASSSSNSNNKISWKFFRDRLLLRRSADAWISSPHSISISAGFIDSIPAQSTAEIAAPENPPEIGSPGVVHTDLAAALAAERQQQQQREVGVMPVRVSLMALLEETDICPAALDGNCDGNGNGDGNGEGEQEAGKEIGKGENFCCVCMVRQKGAAFIPCGHTFCRLCSRELWISRGNCPLCNASIQEILDIF